MKTNWKYMGMSKLRHLRVDINNGLDAIGHEQLKDKIGEEIVETDIKMQMG